MDLKQRIINSFNSGAYSYDKAADIQKLTAKSLAQDIADFKTHHILEIGCGTGLFSRYLFRLFPNAHCLLTDIAPKMVEFCEGQTINLTNVEVSCLDGESLILPRQFDLIVSNMTFHWFLHFQKSIANLLAKLTPQGGLFFSLMGENSLPEWKAVCSQFGVTTLTPPFPKLSDIQNAFPQFELRSELVTLKYRSAHDFLKTLKRLGATTTHYQHSILTVAQLRRIMNAFDNTATAKKKVTYEIIYGRYIKHD